MKKVFALVLLLLGMYPIVSAQVCKISDTGDNVEVFSTNITDGHTISVVVGNDSQDKSANVTVNVSTEIKIEIPEKDKQGRTPVSAKTLEITGNKCL